MNDSIIFDYLFKYEDGTTRAYKVVLDPKTMTLIPNRKSQPLEWTQLGFKQCGHCPLNKEKSPQCPIALNISHLVEEFKEEVSHKKCRVIVQTTERSYYKETSVQIGLHSILGIIMATSGCPTMDFLKPMARFHLPFASIDETLVRSISMYLIGQHLKLKKGESADFELKGLENAYNGVKLVNSGILNRIRSFKSQDAGKNAITILDSFADILNSEIFHNLERLEKLVKSS